MEASWRLYNSDLSSPGGDKFHYCWHGRGGCCCASRGETVQKLTNAYMNWFIGHNMPVATLSKSTHVQTVKDMLCAGFACRNIFVDALVSGLTTDEHAE